MSKLTQIALDFGEDPQSPPPAAGANGSGREETVRPYMAAAGVGVRVKSYKQVPAVPQHGGLFERPESAPSPTNGSLFGDAASEPEPAAEPVTESEAEKQTVAIIDSEADAAMAAETAAREEPGCIAEPEVMVEDGIEVSMENRIAATAELPRRKPAAKRPPVKTVKQGSSKRGRKSLKQVAAEADLIEIPMDEVLFSKQYYTMGEVSEMFRVNQSLLRFWETEFDILQPRKNKKGDRYFRPIDIKNLHLIYHLLRQKKYTIEGAKEFLKTNKKADERFAVIQRLQQIKAFLLEWKAQL